jgi:hypothetical protein
VADSRAFGTTCMERALWSGPLPPHTLENVGSTELRVIAVELKNRNRRFHTRNPQGRSTIWKRRTCP